MVAAAGPAARPRLSLAATGQRDVATALAARAVLLGVEELPPLARRLPADGVGAEQAAAPLIGIPQQRRPLARVGVRQLERDARVPRVADAVAREAADQLGV